jgi:predicted RNA-binding Zn-ribbon protein involved in translation (DUF1610 family)
MTNEITNFTDLKNLHNAKFAFNEDNELIDIHNAEKFQYYKCPECGNELKIRDGEIRVKHFYHVNTNNCSYETYMHKIAKEIISKNKKLTYYDYYLKKNKILNFDYIILEKNLGLFRPDCIGKLSENDLDYPNALVIIEICVTNPVNKSKLELIKQNNILTIQIKLPKYYINSLDELTNYISNEVYSKEELYNPFHENELNELKKINKKLKEYNSELEQQIKNYIKPKQIYFYFEKIAKNGSYYFKNWKTKDVCFVNLDSIDISKSNVCIKITHEDDQYLHNL